MSSAPSFRPFIFTYLVGLEEETTRAWVVRRKEERKKIYGSLGLGIPLPFRAPMHWLSQCRWGGGGL